MIRDETGYQDFDILIFTETGLNDSFNDAQLELPQFTIYRTDRSSNSSSKHRFGGVLVAVKNHLPSIRIESSNTIEQVHVSVGGDRNQFIISAVYIPPESPSDKYSIFCETVESIHNNNLDKHFYIFGDFNMPKTNWRNEGLSCFGDNNVYTPPSEREACVKLNEMCALLNLYQCNNVKNVNDKTLDLVFAEKIIVH